MSASTTTETTAPESDVTESTGAPASRSATDLTVDRFGDLDFKVASLALADFGRKEITLAEHEMPGLDVAASRVLPRSARWPGPGSPGRCT